MQNSKIKIVFLSSPDIALKSFDFFINSPDYTVEALVTQPMKPKNRGHKTTAANIVKMAQDASVPVFYPEKISKDENTIAELKKMQPDFFVTFAFGQMLSADVINIPKIATINLHASLLPQYRGANPICQAIADGCTKTGITTMKTVLAMDAGDICLQKEIEILPEMTVIDLMNEISALSPELLDKTLKGLYSGTLETIPQDESRATFTKKIKKEEKEIIWQDCSDKICNKIRAMYVINTNHTTYKDKIIKILKAKPCDDKDCVGRAGEIVCLTKEGIKVACGTGALEIIKIKPEGKGEMFALDWARGARIEIGEIFR